MHLSFSNSMYYTCLGMISVGALIMGYSIYTYCKTLMYMREQTYDKKVFNQWMYGASLIMMLFFLIGYVLVGVMFSTSEYEAYFAVISLIFFFGAIFVLCMVKVQRMMSETITSKTTETIQSMVRAMEAKDIYTKGHSEHVRKLSLLIYEHLPLGMKRGINPVNLADAAMLHDIGKIGIPDNILNKPGKLTPDEMEVIKSHPKNGKAILENTCYRDICDWILYHHERIDGNGYYNLPGMAIPLETRIISLADMFSALYTDRVYRKRFSLDEALAIIRKESGAALDPALVGIFCAITPDEINRASVL